MFDWFKKSHKHSHQRRKREHVAEEALSYRPVLGELPPRRPEPSPQHPTPPGKNSAEMMRQMRLKMMNAPSELSLKPTEEYPRVCGVVMDWPLQMGILTLVSLSTGDASIYSTGTFGVLGGIGHEAVRNTATNCVKVAERHYGDAVPTKEYSYPASGRVRYYLVCYDGVRMIEADLEAVTQGRDKSSDLYVAAQRVITELRLITQKQKGEIR